MDDPWGSPWADELHQSIPAPAAEGTNGLTLAPMAEGKHAATSERTNSSWDLPGDAFGSWPVAPVIQEIKGSSDTSSANPDWETRGAGDIKKIDVGGLSPNWDESQAGSGHSTPKLSLTPLPKPTDFSREPSPDPWATALVSPDTDQKDIQEAQSQDKEVGLERTEVTLPETSGLESQEQPPANPKVSLLPTAADDTSLQETDPETGPEDTQTTVEISEQDRGGKDADEVSRSSSSPSDQSHHNEGHSESPRTSLDDDTQRPEVHRHVSEKIQVLVEHYDTLAKAQLGEADIVSRGPHSDQGEDGEEEPHEEEKLPSEVGPEVDGKEKVDIAGDNEEEEGEVENKCENEDEDEDEDEDDDFGDFEEGNSQISEPIGHEGHPSNDQADPGDVNALIAPKELAAPETKRPPIHAPEKDFGRVEYMVDISALETLYSGLKAEPPSNDPADKLSIPDTIPRDSFASVEERKMWYRLSRFTTLRQHNGGDDDNNYIRISWAESKVREETLKFAGKWMEQDRISGRVVLGGNSKDGSLFGWNDPKAAPMPLATAFAMNRGKTKAQAADPVAAGSEAPKQSSKGHIESHPPSHSQLPPKQRRRSSTKASRTSEEAKQRIQQPVATFGWSSEPQPTPPPQGLDPKPTPPDSLSSSRKPAPSAQLQPSSGIFASASPAQQMPSSLSGWDTSPPPAKSSASIVPSTTVLQNSSNDFNDDWGEMISSPAVASLPQIPPPRGLSHKKSQSLVGMSLPPAQAPSNTSTLPTIPLGSGHRPTSSLDGSSMLPTHNPAPTPAVSGQFSLHTPISDGFNATVNNAAPTTNNTYDPWASADFSVFEAPAPPSKPKSAPPPKPGLGQTHRQSTKSVSFESTRAPPPQRGNGRTRQEIEQDRIVASIIRGLPDLSYMLRR